MGTGVICSGPVAVMVDHRLLDTSNNNNKETAHMEAPRKLKPTGKRCVCAACGEGFNSESAFNKHRIDSPESKYGRRCLMIDEMESKGMARNKAGWWITEPRTK